MVEEKIKERLQVYIDDIDEPMDMRDLAAELNALPLLPDMGGCYFIRPSGEIISVAWDEPKSVQVETEPRICNIAMFQGSKRYPELEDLKPEKPVAAIDCPHCQGTGILRISQSQGITNVICYCGGLGWVVTE